MSCICQYFATAKNRKNVGDHLACPAGGSLATEHSTMQHYAEEKDNCSSATSEVSASELVAAKAEIWVLKKNLSEAQISIENLENLVRTIIVKQNELLSEMYELKRQNIELQDECRMQRDYQTMERNAMMREMYDIKSSLGDRSKILEETVLKNSDLTNALQDANEKIYMMGMKFLKLKSSRSKHSSGHSSSACSERSY